MKTAVWIIIFFLGVVLVALLWADEQVHNSSSEYISSDINRIPMRKVALLLGTSPKLSDGRRNLYFDYRIGAAAKLYRQGKVRYIIVSGDNSSKDYNEPDAMVTALVDQGVPANKIIADYAGLRTLDSVLRARDIFGQESYIVVSQAFHNERAVYLARVHGIQAFGYNAPDVHRYAGLKTKIREYFARVKMFWDVWTDKEAKHGGDKIILPD